FPRPAEPFARCTRNSGLGCPTTPTKHPFAHTTFSNSDEIREAPFYFAAIRWRRGRFPTALFDSNVPTIFGSAPFVRVELFQQRNFFPNQEDDDIAEFREALLLETPQERPNSLSTARRRCDSS